MPPFRASLVSSGLFVMVGKMRLHFWIGSEYLDCYFTDNAFHKTQELIGAHLMNKLVACFHAASSFDSTEEFQDNEEKLASEVKNLTSVITVEGHEEDDFNEYIDGEKIEFDPFSKKKNEESNDESSSESDSESEKIVPFENNLTLKYGIPQERRLFPLYLGDYVFDYAELENN